MSRYSYRNGAGGTKMDREVCGSRIIHHEKVAAAKMEALTPSEIEELSQLFKAFADGSRLRIMLALGSQEMCVCDLAALLDISESAVSHQLRLLRNLKLVVNRRDGTILYYRLRDEHVTELLGVALEHIRENQQVFA